MFARLPWTERVMILKMASGRSSSCSEGAFNPTTGKFLGVLDNSSGYPITINGLWGLMVGNSAFGGSSSLVFSAGPSGYSNGVLGVIKPG